MPLAISGDLADGSASCARPLLLLHYLRRCLFVYVSTESKGRKEECVRALCERKIESCVLVWGCLEVVAASQWASGGTATKEAGNRAAQEDAIIRALLLFPVITRSIRQTLSDRTLLKSQPRRIDHHF